MITGSVGTDNIRRIVCAERIHNYHLFFNILPDQAFKQVGNVPSLVPHCNNHTDQHCYAFSLPDKPAESLPLQSGETAIRIS